MNDRDGEMQRTNDVFLTSAAQLGVILPKVKIPYLRDKKK